MSHYFKEEELEVGQVYRCRLSGLSMLIIQGYTYMETHTGRIKTPNGDKLARYYNPVTGSFQQIDIQDDQFYPE